MKIGQLAAATGTQAETIRFYEREGLLPQAARTEGNFRTYDRGHVERLAFIRHCRCLDMTLDEIRVLQCKDAPQEDCGAVDRLLGEHIDHVATRIRELKALEKELRSLRAGCTADRTAAECGILGGLERAARDHDHGSRGAAPSQHLAGAHAGPARPLRAGGALDRPPGVDARCARARNPDPVFRLLTRIL